MIGVLIIVQPSGGSIDTHSLLAIGSAILWAGSAIATRMLGQSESVGTTLIWSALAGLAFFTLLLPFSWVTPQPGQLSVMLLIGLVSTLGHALMVAAFSRADASLVAPFFYMQLIWATLIGYVAFDAVPSVATVIGATLIIASGAWIAQQERLG